MRFSKDKSPYKTSQGAVTEGEGGEFYYLQISADGLYVATGYYHMATDQLGRFRQAVDGEATGSAGGAGRRARRQVHDQRPGAVDGTARLPAGPSRVFGSCSTRA